MIPFEKIPRGLRVPLFFGELAVNGDVIGTDTQPPQPGISCVGATNTADTGGIWGDVTMVINDTLYDAVMSIDGVLEIDYQGELHSTFKNLSNQNLRVRITSNRLYSSDYGWGENTNPTLSVDFNNGVIEFCLSDQSNPVISCVGATDKIKFAELTGLWDLELNGEYFEVAIQEISVQNYINLMFSDILYVNENVFSVEFGNKSQNNIRIRLIPYSPNSIAKDPSGNDTFLLHEDNSLTFCLSAKFSPVISCDGASNQQYFRSIGGYWDMELNGIFYKSSMDLLQNYIAKNFSDILSVGYDGFMYLVNISSNDQRIRLIPVRDSNYFGPGENNTFIEQEDGSLTFCLKKEEEPFLCSEVDINDLILAEDNSFITFEK